MTEQPWESLELFADGSLQKGLYEFVQNSKGWVVRRNGETHLELEASYKKLKTISCGVCATDLARKYLPFPLPQVIGHEVLAQDEFGQRFVLDINASCLAKQCADVCASCEQGLPTHCQRRLTLGINELPGGFGPWVLVPPGAMYPVPDSIPDDTAVLAEPFAAALHAVDSIEFEDGDTVCILGPRRLGMLLIAALDARRKEKGLRIHIVALVRRQELDSLAKKMGADEVRLSQESPLPEAEVVIDTSGNPQALELAISLAKRELHLKSTHGKGASGLNQLTGFVVDEFRAQITTASESEWDKCAIRLRAERPRTEMLSEIVVSSDEEFDRAVRQEDGAEASWLRPRGKILVWQDGTFDSPLLQAIQARGLVVSSSRCGDFGQATELMARHPRLRDLGAAMVSHRFSRARLAAAMECAASQDAIKVVVDEHGEED